MHIAIWKNEKSPQTTDTRNGILTLIHAEYLHKGSMSYGAWQLQEKCRWQLLHRGSEGFAVVDSRYNVVETAPYGGHDICWGWMINKAIEIEEMNNANSSG